MTDTIKNTVLSVLVLMKWLTLLNLVIVANIKQNKKEMRDTTAYGATDGKIQSGKKITKNITDPEKDF